MNIRPVIPSDTPEWFRMRDLLWPGSPADHEEEIASYFEHPTEPIETLVLDRGDGQLGGFIELNVRNYAEGCAPGPVAYVEGWYIDGDLRRQGWGSALLRAAEAWARARGLSEIASDAEIENEISIAAHKAFGFEETDRIVCLRKTIPGALSPERGE